VKVLLDAFLEVYHLKSIHQNTVDRFLDHRGTHISLYKNGHSRMVTPFKRKGWQDPGVAGLPEIENADPFITGTNISLNVYPNLVTPLATAGLPFLSFWPLDLKTMLIEVHWFGLPWGEGPRPTVWDTRIKNFHFILEEDLQFADSIQRSVESDGFTGDRRIGPQTVPEPLRVAPVLESYVET
jgi:hypothetical protein